MKVKVAARAMNWGTAVCLTAIVLYTFFFTYLQIILYRGLHMGITDLGYFDQSMYNTLHGRPLQVSFDIPSTFRQLQSSNSPHLFAQHAFVLMVLFVLPVYAAIPHTYTLFFIQALAAAIGALPIYLFAREKIGLELPAVAISLAYLLHPTLQFITVNMFTFGFHPENLFPPLFLASFYFLQREKWALFGLFFLLATLVVDSYTLACAALGVYVIWTRPRRWWLGVAMITVSLAWLILSLWVIIPHFKSGGGSPWFVANMKGGWLVLERLPELPALIMGPLAEYLARVLGPFLFLPILGLPILALALPILMINFCAPLVGYGAPASFAGWQSNPIIPIAALAAVGGLAFLRRRICAFQSGPRTPQGMRLLSAAILATAVGADVWYGPLPFSLNTAPNQYTIDPVRVHALEQVRSLIPDSAVLSADYYLGSQFTRRQWLYWFPDHWADADFVLIDRSSEWTMVYLQQMQYLEDSPYHELVFDKANIVLYRRRAIQAAQPTHRLEANFGNMLKLRGYTIEPEMAHPGDTLHVTLFWESQGPTPVPYTVFVHLLDPSGRIISQHDSMPMSNTHPTTEWTPGEQIVDMYYQLSIGKSTPPGTYYLEIGLYHVETGKRLDVLDWAGNPQETRVIIPDIRVHA